MNKGVRKIKFVLVLLSIVLFKTSLAQTSRDSLMNYSKPSIDLKLLVGFWQTTDSLKSKIEFIDSNSFEVTLDLKNKSHPYFFLKNKQNMVSVSGFYPNWPPFSCDLNLIEPNTLDISFSQLGVSPYTVRCKKL